MVRMYVACLSHVAFRIRKCFVSGEVGNSFVLEMPHFQKLKGHYSMLIEVLGMFHSRERGSEMMIRAVWDGCLETIEPTGQR